MYILFEKNINISELELASPGNRHCANCIGALSFSIIFGAAMEQSVEKYVYIQSILVMFAEVSADKKNLRCLVSKANLGFSLRTCRL